MQCTNCRFQNMPGTQSCVRCGTSLGLATAVIDVHPPRAGRFTKTFRRAVRFGPGYYRVRDAVSHAGAAASEVALGVAPTVPATLPPLPALLRLVVPGWSHFYIGQRTRGHLFLWSFLAFLLPGLLMLGTTSGSILLGLAFSIHSSAALDLAMQASGARGLRQQLVYSVVVSIVLAALVYLPAALLLRRYADPHTLTLPMIPFSEGDVVLVNRRAEPRPGTVVLYDVPFLQMQVPGRGHMFIRYGGERIDRILAGPGDKFRWEKGQAYVNGKPSPWRPLQPQNLPPRLSMDVGPDQFLILPTTAVHLQQPDTEQAWETLSLIGRENIAGRVYARTQPLSHFKIIR